MWLALKVWLIRLIWGSDLVQEAERDYFHLQAVAAQLDALESPPTSAVIASLVAGCAGLELAKGEHREIKSIPPMWGVVEIRGNATPEILYRVFDEPTMEFVTVRAYPSVIGSKVMFTYTITPDDSKPEETREIAPKPEFEAPFWELARHLYRYFPLLPERKEPPRVVA